MSSRQNCHLVIETEIISPSGHIEKTQLEAEAIWYIQGEDLVVSYQEGSGVEEVFCELLIPNNQKSIRIRCSGARRLDHLFTVGERTDSLYEISHGYMDFASITKAVEIQHKNNCPETIVLQYQLFICQEEVGQFTITHKIFDKILPNVHEVVH